MTEPCNDDHVAAIPKLYTEFASIYDDMYKSIFDYDEENTTILSAIQSHTTSTSMDRPIRLLEIGCGSGHLAEKFLSAQDDGFVCDYRGVDISPEMIRLARERNAQYSSRFFVADMRHLSPSTFGKNDDATLFDVVVITRSFCHLTTNRDVIEALLSIKSLVSSSGLLIFDTFSAKGIFTNFISSERVNEAGMFVRTSVSRPNLDALGGWTWTWHSQYKRKEKEEEAWTLIGEEEFVVRAMTSDEVGLFLALTGFDLIQVTHKETWLDVVARACEGVQATNAHANEWL